MMHQVKHTLALVLMVFGGFGCGQNTMELVCKVGDSDYEFQLSIANITARARKIFIYLISSTFIFFPQISGS